MTEEDRTDAGGAEEPEVGEASGSDRKSTRDRVEDGIKEGFGFLSAFKEAVEETIQEAKERGDLSAEKAKEVLKEALERAQAAGERARERLDVVHASELKGLAESLDALAQRVGKLEESVFGASQADPAPDEAPGSENGATTESDEEGTVRD